jgi:hypothetical protein
MNHKSFEPGPRARTEQKDRVSEDSLGIRSVGPFGGSVQ